MPRIDFDPYSSEDEDDLDSPEQLVRPNRGSNQKRRQDDFDQEERKVKKSISNKRIDKRNFES